MTKKKAKEYLHKHGPLHLIKLSMVQMIQFVSSIFLTTPTLAQIMQKHSKINIVKVERLKKMMDNKEVALFERIEMVKRWVRKEAGI